MYSEQVKEVVAKYLSFYIENGIPASARRNGHP
jgi:hypothetical protein